MGESEISRDIGKVIRAIYGNTLSNINGSALKIRTRDGPNSIDIYNNGFYFTGISNQTPGVVQRGWIRLSGDAPDNGAYGITIYNNQFYYPFCDSEQEDCSTARARRCSVSNATPCGPNGCDTRISWTGNDYRYDWARPAAFASP